MTSKFWNSHYCIVKELQSGGTVPQLRWFTSEHFSKYPADDYSRDKNEILDELHYYTGIRAKKSMPKEFVVDEHENEDEIKVMNKFAKLKLHKEPYQSITTKYKTLAIKRNKIACIIIANAFKYINDKPSAKDFVAHLYSIDIALGFAFAGTSLNCNGNNLKNDIVMDIYYSLKDKHMPKDEQWYETSRIYYEKHALPVIHDMVKNIDREFEHLINGPDINKLQGENYYYYLVEAFETRLNMQQNRYIEAIKVHFEPKRLFYLTFEKSYPILFHIYNIVKNNKAGLINRNIKNVNIEQRKMQPTSAMDTRQ